MSPSAAEVATHSSAPAVEPVTKSVNSVKSGSASRLDGPLSYSGSLDAEDQFDVTAVIGREFPKLQLSDILKDDNKLRDLAVLGMFGLLNVNSIYRNTVLTEFQSLSEVSCSSVTKTSTLTTRSTSDRGSVN